MIINNPKKVDIRKVRVIIILVFFLYAPDNHITGKPIGHTKIKSNVTINVFSFFIFITIPIISYTLNYSFSCLLTMIFL